MITTNQKLYGEDWLAIRRFLPADLNASAREHGAMRRARGQVGSAEDLLRLLLMHIAGGLSLEQTVLRAHLQGLPRLNAMALHKRLCTSQKWLSGLTSYLLEGIRPLLQQGEDCWRMGRNVRILDATNIQETGATGTDWRIHYSLRLPQLCCDFFELTDWSIGESLRHLPVEKGDIVLVDRAYNDRKAVAQMCELGADVILRYHSAAFPLLDGSGDAFDPLPKLKTLAIGQTAEWPVEFAVGKKVFKARLCALRKTPDQARRARLKIERKANKKQQESINLATLEFADYVVVICTVSAKEINLHQVLEFYRARWQVELAFKRLKSLLQLGQLPKKKSASSQAWMQGKILTALLIERLICEGRFFSPWGYRL